MSASRALLTLGIGAVFASVSGQASAQNTAAADALFEEGRAALEQGDLDVACPKLQESDRLDPANGTKFNLADCEEKRGKVASAWALYRRLTDSLPADDERLPYVKQHAAALEPRVPHVILSLAPGAPHDTRVKIGTLVLTTAGFGTALPLDPGEQRVVASSGGRSRVFRVVLAEGEGKILAVTPDADAPKAEAPAPSETSSSAPASAMDERTLAYVSGGIGAAGVIVGAVTGIMGLHQESVGNDNCSDALKHCNQRGFDANQSARSLATVSTVGFAVGVIGMGVGSYFLLTSKSNPALAVGARVNGQSAALSMDGRW